MALSLTVAPTVEPVTAAQVKDELEITHSADDDRITNFLIPASRQSAETYTGRAFLSQTYVLRLQAFPVGPIVLPRPPLSSVTSVVYVANDGTSTTWAASKYDVETPSGERAQHGSIRPAYQETYPSTREQVDAVTITFVAGYGATAADVPVGIRLAVMEGCRALYDASEHSLQVAKGLLAPYVAWRYDLAYD